MKSLIKFLFSKTAAYIFTALGLTYFLVRIFVPSFGPLDVSSKHMLLGLLGAANILLFSILYTNLKKN